MIKVEKTSEEAVITVKNDGPEISPRALAHLFDRFYRADESRSQETGGTGLGLAIAQSIVRLHHGDISAHSQSGWTSFIIRLPLNEA